jgi:indole-3-glycerol phosphate synthase
LLDKIPRATVVVTESGIHSQSDVRLMRSKNVNGFLVGEAFMKTPNPGLKLQEMFR